MPINLQPEMVNQESYLIIREKDLLYKELSTTQQAYLMEGNVLACKSHGPCILSHQHLVLIRPV